MDKGGRSRSRREGADNLRRVRLVCNFNGNFPELVGLECGRALRSGAAWSLLVVVGCGWVSLIGHTSAMDQFGIE